MKTKLQKVEDVVKNVLERYPETRADDFKLIFAVYREIDFFHTTKELFCEVMLNHKKYGLPAFESVSRARRKIQKDNPELSNKKIQEARINKTSEYISYAIDDSRGSSFISFVDNQK